MQHRQHIAAVLKQWLEMTHAESQAIQTSNWPILRKLQADKAQLRLTLGHAVERWRADDPTEAVAGPFRDEVNQLMAQETQNGNLLAARKHRAQEKKKLLEQALFNLRRIRSSYTKPPRHVLSSYS